MVKSESHIPKIRFVGFSDAWRKFRIIDIADYVDYRGKTPTKTSAGILLVTAKNIRQGFIDYSASQEFISENEFDNVMSRGKVQLGDVVITTEAPLGNVASIDRIDVALAQRVIKYRGKKNILNNRFLKYRFLTSSFQKLLETKATGGTVQGIKGSTLHKLLIRISCDVNEQTQIGNFFQKIDQVIELQQKALDTAKDYKKSMLQKMFPQKGEKVPQIRFDGFSGDWEEKKIGEIFTATRGQVLAVDKVSNLRTDNFCYPVYSSQTKNDGLLGFYTDFLFEDSITWTTDGANAGTVMFRQGKFYSTNVNGVLLSDFGYANQMVAEYLNTVAHKYVSRVGNPKLMNNIMVEIPIMIPEIEEQQKVGVFFQKLDQQIEQHEKKLESYQNLKKAMLHRMFV